MTPQEQQMLSELLGKLSQAPAAARDPEADAMIQRTLGQRPDALYLLTQIALINDIALKNAQQQIQALQQRVAAPAPAPSSFLGAGGPWGGQPSAPQQQPSYAPQGSSSGFLHSALTTASGVVAGEMAFSALRSLFGGGLGSGFGGGMGMGGGGFLSGAPGSETIVNNYYDDNNGANNNVDDSSDLASADDSSGDDDSNDFSNDNSDFT